MKYKIVGFIDGKEVFSLILDVSRRDVKTGIKLMSTGLRVLRCNGAIPTCVKAFPEDKKKTALLADAVGIMEIANE